MKVLRAKSRWFKESDLRLDAEFHLSEGPISKRLIQKSPYEVVTLEKVTTKIFSGKIFKRTFVNSPKFGLPYLTASDMVKSDIDSGKYISKKLTVQKSDLEIKSGWILLSCSGTLGNTVFTNQEFSGRIGTHDLIRILPDQKEIKPGFLFAYLASKYGHSLLVQSSYGGVVKHIEPHHIQGLPTPLFKTSIQTKVHNLIIEANSLRTASIHLLNESIKTFENKLPKLTLPNVYKTSIKTLSNNSSRIDAESHIESISEYYRKLSKKFEIRSIQSLSKDVFTPNIFKRVRVNSAIQGIPFLSGSDLVDARPSFNSFLSKKMKNINDYVLSEGWIAIQDAGTIGYVTLINGYLDGVAATNNLVRIVPRKDNYNPYIFAFLRTYVGQSILKSLQYGSVQKHIDDKQVSSIGIPILDSEFKTISKSIQKYLDNTTKACQLETKSISIIENEIQSWQK